MSSTYSMGLDWIGHFSVWWTSLEGFTTGGVGPAIIVWVSILIVPWDSSIVRLFAWTLLIYFMPRRGVELPGSQLKMETYPAEKFLTLACIAQLRSTLLGC